MVVIFLVNTAFSYEYKEKTAKETVQLYCQSDFDGVSDIRFDIAKFSSQREKEERKYDSKLKGTVIYWDASPLFVVSSYEILDVEVNNKVALAVVKYKRLAKTIGYGTVERKLVPDYKDEDIVKLHLSYTKNKWVIIDPPLPRISKKALIQFYESDFRNYGEKWLERSDITDIQKKTYLHEVKTLELLRGLVE